MPFHIILPRILSDEERSATSVGGHRPRSGFALLAKRLNASIHDPKGTHPSLADKLLSRVAGPDTAWAVARRLTRGELGRDDILFCGSEAGGLQVSQLCGRLRDRPKISMFVHNLDRPRGRLALRLFQAKRHVDLFLACSETQVQFLRDFLELPDERVQFIRDHTDTSFFCPGANTESSRHRPCIVSVGLEQRDYKTLAEATRDLDVEVKISGFSEDAATLARTFPAEMPSNMSRGFYSWPDLVNLYRGADVVVVSVRENKYAAGVQALMEAMACRRPVVVTQTIGLASYLEPGTVKVVPPGNADEMRRAIVEQLTDRSSAEKMAERGFDFAQRHQSIERYVDDIAQRLVELARATRPPARS